MASSQLFDARDLLPFPTGANSSDTVLGGVHLNLTAIQHWNYTYYSNGTLSNGSNCWLTYEPYQPVYLFGNGSFVNATSCYSAVDPIGVRGYTGIGFAAAFGLALILTITVLAKHGKLYLPKERRFYPIGRRWQWYWACFVSACGLIGLFTNIDIDRYHVQQIPIVVTCFFWFLICQGTLALVWEAARHWGSWQERQYIDPNPFIYSHDDKRAQLEFWLPLWFYFWVWMNFFLVIPRSWTFVEYQRSPQQVETYAIPAATSARFKAGAFCLVVAWLTICFSLHHSILYYSDRTRGIFGFVRSIPLRLVLLLGLSLALIAYQILISFNWTFSVMRYGGIVPVIFAWGYGPSLLILYIQVVYGYATPNEDKALILQRQHRGDMIDRELGIVKKPAWWRRVKGEHLITNLRDKISNNVNEVGGQRGVGRRVENDLERHARLEAEMAAINDDGIEMSSLRRTDPVNPRVDRAGVRNMSVTSTPVAAPLYSRKSDRRHAEQMVETFAGVLFPGGDGDSERAQRIAEISQDGPPPPYRDEDRGRQSQPGLQTAPRRNESTSTTDTLTAPPQQVRSMLDI